MFWMFVVKVAQLKVYSGAGDFQKGISLSESENNIKTFEYYNSKFIVFNSLSYGDSKYNWIVFDTLGNIIAKRERTIPIFMSGCLEVAGHINLVVI